MERFAHNLERDGTWWSGDGSTQFFAGRAYHFQTVRVLDAIPFGRADTSEVLQTIRHIRTGDAQSWHAGGALRRISSPDRG